MLRLNSYSKLVRAVPLLAALIVGCSQDVRFGGGSGINDLSTNNPVTPLPAPTPPTTSSVTPPAQTCSFSSRLTKIMFLVDTSGSNVLWSNDDLNSSCTDPTYLTCFAPTDPNKTFRMGSIQNFFNQYQSKSNFQWNFTTFAGTTAQPLIAASSGAATFAPASAMQAAINTFAGMQDVGATPFQAALNAATTAISADPDHNSATANPQYFVIMLTDGYATDFTSSQSDSSDVASLIAAAPSVSLNTIFYGAQDGPDSAYAINLLQSMAQMGKGQFANVNNPASGININDLITTNCPQ